MKKLVMVAGVAAILAGCTTYDPYTGEKKLSKASVYGVASAVLVGGVAAATGDDHALDKAVIAGTLGAGVGLYQDKQEAKLRAQLQGTGVSVQRSGDSIILVMPGNIVFATNEYSVQPSFYSVLNSVALVAKEYNKTTMVVTGHTDSDGSESYNMSLSQKRAASVAEYLATRGVPYARLMSRGMGESSPIASNTSAAGKQANRRVEITIVPNQ